MRRLVVALVVSVAPALWACSYQAQECCDCMATKRAGPVSCLNDTLEHCNQALAASPPNVNVVSSLCIEEKTFCPDSCRDILYRK